MSRPFEEIERTAVFMLRHRAAFEATFHRSIEALVQQQARFAADMMQIEELGGELARRPGANAKALADLGESRQQLAESGRQLADSQRTIEARLRPVLKGLERGHKRDGRGRKAG